MWASCKKNELPANEDDTGKVSTPSKKLPPKPKYNMEERNTAWDSAANTSNPADSAGYIHNLAVDYAVINVSTELDAQVGYDSVFSYLQNYWGSSFNADSIKNLIPVTYMESEFSSGGPSNYHNYIDSLTGYSSTVKSDLNDLVDIMEDTINLPSTIPYDTIKANIVAWETSVQNDGSLSSTDKDLLYRTGSIARFSLFYWHIKADDEWNSLTLTQKSHTTRKRKWWQWVIIGVVDAGGVVAGFISHNPTGGISAGAGASNTAYNITGPK
jgi:hypothetical protein